MKVKTKSLLLFLTAHTGAHLTKMGKEPKMGKKMLGKQLIFLPSLFISFDSKFI